MARFNIHAKCGVCVENRTFVIFFALNALSIPAWMRYKCIYINIHRELVTCHVLVMLSGLLVLLQVQFLLPSMILFGFLSHDELESRCHYSCQQSQWLKKWLVSSSCLYSLLF